MSTKYLKLSEIAGLLGVPLRSCHDPNSVLTHVSGFASADAASVVFADSEKAFAGAMASDAGLVLSAQKDPVQDRRTLQVAHPRYAFALCAKAFATTRETSSIHPSAVVHPSAQLGERVVIGAKAVIEQDVRLGDEVEIGSGAVLMAGVRLGNRVVVQPGAVLGATGFGYVRSPETGAHLLFPQQGTLVIEDDVEIGANTTIDRGALGETRIGSGTKIDNQVHIGHNCRIGRNVLIAAQVGISGSCVVEDGAVLAGQVGLGDHVSIGPGVILGGAAGVFPGKRLEGAGQMFMGVPAEPLKRYLKTIARLRKLDQKDAGRER